MLSIGVLLPESSWVTISAGVASRPNCAAGENDRDPRAEHDPAASAWARKDGHRGSVGPESEYMRRLSRGPFDIVVTALAQSLEKHANDRSKLIPAAAIGRPFDPESGISSINLRFKTSPTDCDPQIPIDRASGASAFS